MRITRAVVTIILLAFGNSAYGAEHRVVAEAGDIQALLASGDVKGGDHVILESGYYGSIIIRGMAFDRPVHLIAAKGARARIDRLVIGGSVSWRIEGLIVGPETGVESGEPLVHIHDSSDIRLDRLTVASAKDTSDWAPADWRRFARNGIRLTGSDISVSNSFIRNVRHGITSYSDGALVEGNVVELFSGDGIRGLGDNSVYRGNTVSTCVDVDENHDDGFQSWSLDAEGRPGKGVVRNVRVENNLILNGEHPLACRLQGIGLFDGLYEDWVIRENTVIVDHWHGITVMGARRVEIVENTVVDSAPGEPGAPWITITAHKDGRIAEDSTIANNVTLPWSGGSRSPFSQPQPGVTLFGNRVVNSMEEALSDQR